MVDWDRIVEARRASLKVHHAILSGKLERPSTCELCEEKPKKIKVKNLVRPRPGIFAHHWNGYSDPLNVWWICHKCNVRLSGPEFHNGSVSKSEAKKYIRNFTYKKPERGLNPRCQHKNCGNWAEKGGQYCYHHKPNSSRIQCKGITEKGCRCRVRTWGDYCWRHRPE